MAYTPIRTVITREPSKGLRAMRIPKTSDRIPVMSRKPFSDFGVFFLNQAIKKINPSSIAHIPMMVTKTAADTSGLNKITIPSSKPMMPSSRTKCQPEFSFLIRMEPMVKTNPPVKIENAKYMAKAIKVIVGNNKATKPNIIAKKPFRLVNNQFCNCNFSIMMFSIATEIIVPKALIAEKEVFCF